MSRGLVLTKIIHTCFHTGWRGCCSKARRGPLASVKMNSMSLRLMPRDRYAKCPMSDSKETSCTWMLCRELPHMYSSSLYLFLTRFSAAEAEQVEGAVVVVSVVAACSLLSWTRLDIYLSLSVNPAKGVFLIWLTVSHQEQIWLRWDIQELTHQYL